MNGYLEGRNGKLVLEMQLDPATIDSADKVFHMAIAAGSIACAAVGVMIKLQLAKIALNQEKAKSELIEHQLEIKDELNAKHRQNQQDIAVHTAEDKVQFESISRTLTRIDGKLDKLNGH